MSLASGSIGGPGVLLPPPVALYPTGLANTPALPATNLQSLAPGDAIQLPRGTFLVSLGGLAELQWLNPVTTVWEGFSSARAPVHEVISDGNNFRVINLTGCQVGAIVVSGGTIGYAQSTTTVSSSIGGAQYLAIVGGQLGTTVTIPTFGSGYALPPLVFCPAPPAPGVPASFIATIANGTVSGITCLNQGAGYTGTQTLSILPSPYDANLLSGTPPVAATALATIVAASGSATNGKITAVLCVNPGSALTAAPTLSVTGASAGASIVSVPMWTATGLTVTTGSTVSTANGVISVGGIPSATPAFTNPAIEFTGYTPRPAQMQAAVASGTLTLGNTVSAIYDGGLFTGTPTPLLLGATGLTGGVSMAFILGSANATVSIQPVG